jgi:hypothetical protein
VNSAIDPVRVLVSAAADVTDLLHRLGRVLDSLSLVLVRGIVLSGAFPIGSFVELYPP